MFFCTDQVAGKECSGIAGLRSTRKSVYLNSQGIIWHGCEITHKRGLESLPDGLKDAGSRMRNWLSSLICTIPDIEVVMGNQPIRVCLVDDHTMVRRGMKVLLDEYEDIQVVGEASNGLKAIELVEQVKPDVVLIDLAMPVMDGIEAIKRIIANHPDERIIVLTSFAGDDKLFEAIRAGAMGYLVKDAQPEELVQSIRNVCSGEPSLNPAIAWRLLRGMTGTEASKRPTEELSEREIEVLRLLTKGKTDQEIAQQLVLTDVTIRTHISRILSKLGLKNRVQAALYGIRSGLVSLDETNNIGEGSDK